VGILAGLGAAAVPQAAEPDLTQVPGVVIDHLPAADGRYVGSPGLAVLPNGDYVASHDYFGPRSGEHERALTAVFRSPDQGATWEPISTVNGEFWSTLFAHRDALYLIGTESHYGHAIVRRSEDGGRTWTDPVDGSTGRLFEDRGYHCAPMPVLLHRNRLWRAMEDSQGPSGWGTRFHSFMMSIAPEADLLQATNWTFSNRILGQTNWLDGRFRGWLEGNAVVAPDGRVVNMLRVATLEWPEYAAMIRISNDGRQATFDPESGFIEFPGGAKKFTIRHDPQTGLYWSLANYIPPRFRDRKPSSTRNTLALLSSPDLRHWDVKSVLLHHPDPVNHGFQYVEWLLDGDDLIAASRTAYDDGLGGAHNNHDANFLTFHRITDFRQRTLADSPIAIREEVLEDETAQSGVPRVLLLGDSISIGYHPFVREALGRDMVVMRPTTTPGRAENCEGTTKGVAAIDRWLNRYGGRWDVIHFNWGLHDLKRVNAETRRNSNNPEDPPQADLATYERQLRRIVARLKQTDATLIFATTTPVPAEPVRPWREEADVVQYNEAAKSIMRENDIPVNDLHALAAAHLAEWQKHADVHFKPAGSRALGAAVVAGIREALDARQRP
jgi:lysophospholipase L1-like esterase